MTLTDGQTTVCEVRACPADTVVRVRGPLTPMMPGRIGVVVGRAEAPWLEPGQMGIRLLSAEDPRQDSWLTLRGGDEVEVLAYPKTILADYARRVAEQYRQADREDAAAAAAVAALAQQVEEEITHQMTRARERWNGDDGD